VRSPLNAKLLKTSELKKRQVGRKGNEKNMENEGITLNVDENKGPVSHSLGITLNVYEK
jgi:hypothetical protein